VETPHERWFESIYGPAILKCVNTLRAPPLHFKDSTYTFDVESIWRPFHDLWKELSRTLKPATLNVRDVSPVLFTKTSTAIPMPGVASIHSVTQQKDEMSSLTIHAFESSVVILPTKTRPKKVSIIGSDGHRYPYLIKGREVHSLIRYR